MYFEFLRLTFAFHAKKKKKKKEGKRNPETKAFFLVFPFHEGIEKRIT